MRVVAFLFSVLLATVFSTGASAEGQIARDWRIAPIKNDGAFVFCGMSTSLESVNGPLVLTIALDRADDWAVSLHGEGLSLPLGPIAGRVQFDEQNSVDVAGAVRAADTLSFLVHGGANLMAAANARRLNVSFGNRSLTFDLGNFAAAFDSLQECRNTNARQAQSSTAIPPQPYFASLKAARVEVRAAPGPGAAVQWIYIRRNLPVEIVASDNAWKQIRDLDGAQGWVSSEELSGDRFVTIRDTVGDVRRDANSNAPVVARLERGVTASVIGCGPAWCEIRVNNYRGWIDRNRLWGIEPAETFGTAR